MADCTFLKCLDFHKNYYTHKKFSDEVDGIMPVHPIDQTEKKMIAGA